MSGDVDPVVVGFKYSLSEHMALCHGPIDKVTRIWVGDKLAWSGSAAGDTTVNINKPNLFGGESKEGGVEGPMMIRNGQSTQQPDSYLSGLLGSLPAFRGMVTLLWKRVYQSAMNPYIKKKRIEVVRQWQGWYPEKASSGADVNGVHILYELFTNAEWGRGISPGLMKGDTWSAAADTTAAEGLYLSIAWRAGQTLDDFIQEVVEHVGCVIRENHATGQLEIKLLRDDYNPIDLPLFNDTNADLLNHNTTRWLAAANKFIGRWTDPATRNETTLTLHSPATRRMSGQEVVEAKNYRGACSAELCSRLLERDRLLMTTPHDTIKIRTDRTGANLNRGDTFRFSWDKPLINDVVFRVLDINYGKPGDSSVEIDAVEDLFRLPSGSYLTEQASTNYNPFPDPLPVANQTLFEASYWHLAQSLGDEAAQQRVEADNGWVAAAAAKPGAGTYQADTVFDYGTNTRKKRAAYTPFATVSGATSAALSSTLNLLGSSRLNQVRVNELALLGDEWVRVDSVDVDNDRVTVSRGLLDTVPQDHPDGIALFFIGPHAVRPDVEFNMGQTVGVKFITLASSAQLDDANAPRTAMVVSNRAYRPLPPGNVTVNGGYFPASVADTVTVAWAHRHRTQQTAGLTLWNAGNIGPEPGITYTLRFKRGNTLLREITGITDTSYSYSPQDEIADIGSVGLTLTIELLAVRDGANSWQTFIFTMGRTFTSTGDGFDLTAVDDGNTIFDLTGVAS